ncbi:MAG: tellurite resistance protein [Candidatus Azotimanducaceae bacterium]|jgi:tellurite resistance protein
MFLSSLTQNQKETFLCLAHNVVVSDGDLTVDEELMMDEMRREMNIDRAYVPHYVELEGIEEIFTTRKARSTTMIALIRLGYADGAFEVEEESFLRVLCKTFEISESDFSLLDNWVKRLVALEKEASVFM